MALDRKEVCDYIIENQGRWYRIALSYVHKEEAAMDMVQNTAVKILENYPSITYLKTWSYRVLIHECIAFLKKEKREIISDMVDPKEEKIMFSKGDMNDYISQLPDKMRLVIILYYYEDLTMKEIAAVTRTNVNTVKYRHYAALRKLKEKMEGK